MRSRFPIVLFINLVSIVVVNAADSDNTFNQDYGATVDWQAVDTRVTLSQYVYRDRNDSGVYDLGDVAMATVRVSLDYVNPDGSLTRLGKNETNEAGFANFIAQEGSERHPIKQSGTYLFTVYPPPGWHSPSGNTEQRLSIDAKPNTRSGLFLADYLQPVGLAQNKRILGVLPNAAGRAVSLKDAAGTLLSSKLVGVEGRFSFDVEPGRYQINSGALVRNVTVGNLPVLIGSLRNQDKVSTHTRIASFDDLPQHGLYKVPNGYLGIGWRDINALRRNYTPGRNEGYVNGITSGAYLAYTSQARHGEIYSEQPFDFISVNLAIGWRAAEGQELLIEMWRSDQKVVADKMRLSILGPVHYAPNVANVTRVRFSPKHGWQTTFDDLVIGHHPSFKDQ